MRSHSTDGLVKGASLDGTSGRVEGMQFPPGEIHPEQTLMDRVPDRAFPVLRRKFHRKPCES